nr:MAG TPA: hypothetical protein [Caudoviricetes sp.]
MLKYFCKFWIDIYYIFRKIIIFETVFRINFYGFINV